MRKTTGLLLALLALALAAPGLAQNKVKTEPVPPKAAQDAKPAEVPEAISDLSRLPDKVRQMRERILEAAKTGDLGKVATVMQSNELMPVFNFGGEKDPIEFWKSSYPDSDGLEALSILIEILEMPFVHLDKGTPQ